MPLFRLFIAGARQYFSNEERRCNSGRQYTIGCNAETRIASAKVELQDDYRSAEIQEGISALHCRHLRGQQTWTRKVMKRILTATFSSVCQLGRCRI
jgi:hypothetical protein